MFAAFFIAQKGSFPQRIALQWKWSFLSLICSPRVFFLREVTCYPTTNGAGVMQTNELSAETGHLRL